jgi:predicted kinase
MSDAPLNSLILIRGLPGSGKSTFARLLSENGKYPVTSIDDYFTDPETGEYTFDPLKNYLAYKQCRDLTEKHLMEGIKKVFVENTFTIEWEMEPYFKLAKDYNYRLFVLTLENRHHGINVHHIPQEQLEKMASKYKVQLLP